MRIRKALSILLAVSLLLSSSLLSGAVFGAQNSNIELQLDKTTAKVGEIITATLSINNISNFAGYQVNLKYDPAVLQPVKSTGVQYTNSTMPEKGTILNNSDFGVLPQAVNNITSGILNFGKVYTNLDDYKASGTAETSGKIAVICFKVLQEKATSVAFENSKTMPNADSGTILVDWNGNRIDSGYSVVQPGIINSDNQNPMTDSNISLVFDKTSAAVGEIVKATVKVNNIANFAGYQVNLKYDPNVLQPVTSSGKAFTNSTNPAGGTLLKNEDYGILPMASNDITKGILNFTNSYVNLGAYKADGNAETSGTLAVIDFKVLQGKATTVSFENTAKMPNALTGTLLFNWDGSKINSGYTVNQAGILNTDGQQVVNGNVSLALDKTIVSVGDIVNATVKIDGIKDFAGYQVNLTYDPTILQPVTTSGNEYTNSTMPADGTMLSNSDFGAYPIAAHNLSGGILSFGKSYTNLKAYKASGSAETSGTLAVVSFKVIQAKTAAILFENSATMPNGISGTMMFDWNGDKILSGYTVTQPAVITVNGGVVHDTSCIKLDLDKTSASIGEIITATLKAEAIAGLSGYQVNLKYDPAVLQPVNPTTGAAYEKNTNPLAGSLINNSDYGIIPFAAHDLKSGVLNFSRSYTNLKEYSTNANETTGTLAVVGFKVLKKTATNITFENSGTMPSAIMGTMLFDSFGNKIKSGYSIIQPETINADSQSTDPGYITLRYNKSSVLVGDTIKANIVVNNIDNLAGYQVNLKYDPEVLMPVTSSGTAYTNSTLPEAGDLLVNQDYGIMPVAAHNLSNGILNFGKSYTNLQAYRSSGVAEKTGILAVVSFKVLKVEGTFIKFESSNTMSNGISGTMMFDWNADRIRSGYNVVQPAGISVGHSTDNCVRTIPVSMTPAATPTNTAVPTKTPAATPTNTVIPTKTATATPTHTVKPTMTPAVNPTNTITPTKTAAATPTNTAISTKTAAVTPTNTAIPTKTAAVTPTNTITPTKTPVVTPTATIAIPTQSSGESYITIDLDKVNEGVNGTIKATVRINNIDNFSGYQANLIYDPEILQPVTSSGTAYSKSSIPSSGTILTNSDYGVIPAASHNLTAGVLNFGKLYTNLEDYRTAGTTENTGTLAVINFKVLKTSTTSIKFENSGSMPNGISGTMLFDYYGNRITSGYKVVQPAAINDHEVPPTAPSYITMEFDKTTAGVGETIKASLKVYGISKLSGYQVNLQYDPTLLQPVKSTGAGYSNGTIPTSGTLIANEDFGPINAVSHDLTSGLLNFGKLYTNLEDYKASGNLEETGTLAVIEFKVLKSGPATVLFKNSNSMPNGKDGTILLDCDGNRITSGYYVVQPAELNK